MEFGQKKWQIHTSNKKIWKFRKFEPENMYGIEFSNQGNQKDTRF